MPFHRCRCMMKSSDLMLSCRARRLRIIFQKPYLRWPVAAGIHIIMATQRPSVDVIAGTDRKLIFLQEFLFRLGSKIDSRTILGENKVLSNCWVKGTCYLCPLQIEIVRIHGALIYLNKKLKK